MASAGGHWAKSNFPGHVGKVVFIPAAIEGVHPFMEGWETITQGQYAVIKPDLGYPTFELYENSYPNQTPGTGIYLAKYDSKDTALLAMQALNATGVKSEPSIADHLKELKEIALGIKWKVPEYMPKAPKTKSVKPKTARLPQETTPIKENSLFGL